MFFIFRLQSCFRAPVEKEVSGGIPSFNGVRHFATNLSSAQRRRDARQKADQRIGQRDPLIGKAMIRRSEEHTSELQSLMRISYAVFCLKKKNINNINNNT